MEPPAHQGEEHGRESRQPDVEERVHTASTRPLLDIGAVAVHGWCLLDGIVGLLVGHHTLVHEHPRLSGVLGGPVGVTEHEGRLTAFDVVDRVAWNESLVNDLLGVEHGPTLEGALPEPRGLLQHQSGTSGGLVLAIAGDLRRIGHNSMIELGPAIESRLLEPRGVGDVGGRGAIGLAVLGERIHLVLVDDLLRVELGPAIESRLLEPRGVGDVGGRGAIGLAVLGERRDVIVVAHRALVDLHPRITGGVSRPGAVLVVDGLRRDRLDLPPAVHAGVLNPSVTWVFDGPLGLPVTTVGNLTSLARVSDLPFAVPVGTVIGSLGVERRITDTGLVEILPRVVGDWSPLGPRSVVGPCPRRDVKLAVEPAPVPSTTLEDTLSSLIRAPTSLLGTPLATAVRRPRRRAVERSGVGGAELLPEAVDRAGAGLGVRVLRVVVLGLRVVDPLLVLALLDAVDGRDDLLVLVLGRERLSVTWVGP